MTEEFAPFSGAGSVLMVDIADFALSASGDLSAVDLAAIMNAHADHVCGVIAKHGGTVYQYIGDAVVAYWVGNNAASGSTDVAHAELSMLAACELLQNPVPENLRGKVRYALDLCIGSGEMVGAYFGPIRQFQIVGAAYSIANRLSQLRHTAGRGLRISQFTLDLLESREGFVEMGIIEREHAAALTVWTVPITERRLS